MKPKVFIGSSVEGLTVAYALQTNLMHVCEPTVWSQGVFELSQGTLSTLLNLLEKVDFAIFIFSPDDIVNMRDVSRVSVRDNVIFEFGLFLGKLGDKRVFFIKPLDEELHLPTDLLGITPGTYKIDRSDENIVAAIGPAAHQVALMIKKYGSVNFIEEDSNTPEIVLEVVDDDWLDDVINEKYSQAVEKLEIQIDAIADTREKMKLICWQALCKYRMDEKNYSIFDDILNQYSEDVNTHINIAKMLIWEEFYDKAIKVTESAKIKFGESARISQILAECHLKNGDKDLAIECFSENIYSNDPKSAIMLADIYIDNEDFIEARKILHLCYLNFPKNKQLLNAYASVCAELELDTIALLFYDNLSQMEPDNSTYKGYVGNSCNSLNLHDIAMQSYQKANELASGFEAWILANMGNLLKNRGLNSEATKFLNKALEIDKTHEYSLNRLSTAIKAQEEESKKYKLLIIEGRNLLKEYSANLLLEI